MALALSSRAQWRSQLAGLARGSVFWYRRGTHPVVIAELASPLRYDVVVRARFFELLIGDGSLLGDPERLMEAARRHPYHVWFRDVYSPAWTPELLGDEAGLRRAFERRVDRTVRLLRSFEERGFDAARPITVYGGRRVSPTDTGKRLARRLYAGDGCHRLALLIVAGAAVVEPDQYRVMVHVRLKPNDTTPRMLERLQLAPEEYLRFVGWGYGLTGASTEQALLVAADERGAAVGAEVRAVLAADARARG